jgi:hypothetical protein
VARTAWAAHVDGGLRQGQGRWHNAAGATPACRARHGAASEDLGKQASHHEDELRPSTTRCGRVGVDREGA